MKIRLTPREAALLDDQLDMVLQGMSDAYEKMEVDDITFSNMEEWMETVAQAVDDMETIKDIRKKVNDAQRGRSTPRALRALPQRLPRHAG